MLETIVIGIDGLSWEFVDPLLQAGRLPRMATLLRQGVRANVQSTIPTISPVAWSSFATGLLPQHHGVLDWYAYGADGTRRPMTSQDLQGTPFWTYLNRAGIRTGIMNVPGTFPAAALDGFMSCGFDAPSGAPEAFYPRTLMGDLRDRFGHEVLEHPSRALLRDRGPEAYVGAYVHHDELLTEAAIELSRSYEINTLILNYQTVDHFNHHLAEARHFAAALEGIDRCMDRLQQAFPEAEWLLLSDHGSRKTTQGFLLIDWLEQQGFVSLQRRRLQGFALAEALQTAVGSSHSFVALAIRLAGRLARLLPEGVVEYVVRQLSGSRPVPIWPVPFMDQARSEIAAISPGTCGFYFASRNGAQTPRGDHASAKRLAKALESIRDPRSGARLFPAVYCREELFGDLEAASLPDVIAVATETDTQPVSTTLFPRMSGHCFVPADAIEYYGGHTLVGVGAFAGSAINAAVAQPVALNLWDIPALILRLAGVPIPDDFDGRAPEEIFTASFRNAHPLRTQTPITRRDGAGERMHEDAAVAEKLRGLGYL
jgi:predicted AlkP superfamily phosphohydrolase/phosphomutase